MLTLSNFPENADSSNAMKAIKQTKNSKMYK